MTPIALIAAAVVEPPVYVDLTAVFLAGLTGAVFAVKHKFAISGVLAIAVVAGLGGGLLRDLLLNNIPVALTNPRYLPTVIAAAAVGFFFASLIRRWELMLDILDPIWMGLFAVIGAQMALNSDLSAWAAILTGCVTAFGGGILRDVLAGETPQLVLPGPINYFAAIIGSVLYVSLVTWFSVPASVAEWSTVAAVFGLRMVALRYGLRTPEPVDLPRTLVKGGKAIMRHPRPGDSASAKDEAETQSPLENGSEGLLDAESAGTEL
jgi:uncharacterized membrane protein YeiH